MPSLRKFRRFGVDLKSVDGQFWVRDISFGGMRALSSKKLYVDDPVECELESCHGAIVLEGRVAWARRSGREDFSVQYGIELKPPTREASLRLRMLLYDLSEQGAEQQEGPVDFIEVERLKDRLSELEGDSRPGAAFQQNGSLGEERARDAELDEEGEESRFLTEFDAERFAHLVVLGQPMMALVENPAQRLEAPGLDVVAEAFSLCFDLKDVQEVVGSSLTQESIVESLFVFYQRDLIDFA